MKMKEELERLTTKVTALEIVLETLLTNALAAGAEPEAVRNRVIEDAFERREFFSQRPTRRTRN